MSENVSVAVDVVHEAHAAKRKASSHETTPATAINSTVSTPAPSPSSLVGQVKSINGRDAGTGDIEITLSSVDNKTFTDDDWNIVYFECGSLSAKWEQLSAYIGLSKATIEDIGKNRPRDSAGCWGEALSQWIKQNYTTDRFGLPSWRSLLKAVAMVDNRLCKELSSKHPAAETLQVPDTSVVQSPFSHPQSPAKSTQNLEMIRSNEDKIKALFSGLLLKVQSALEPHYDVTKVRQFLANFLDCDLPETADYDKLFRAVSRNDLWNYQHHSPVERLMNHFFPDDQELKSLMKDYKAHLSGFNFTTKLIDYIDYHNLSPCDDSDEECDQPSPKLTTSQYRKIKIVLELDRKISDLSLNYVVELWRSFADEYDIPSLTAVIKQIAPGSLEVTWRVPQHIADAILQRSKFFRSHGIVLVFIDDVIIYDEKQMANKEEIFLELCYKGTAKIREFSSLLRQGVDPNIYDGDGRHPLWYASNRGRQDLVELFLQYHADVDMATQSDYQETALVAAIGRGNIHIVETLVQNGANVNYRNKKGKSVLWMSCGDGHKDIVLLLLSYHAEVDLPNDDEFGETPLIAAVDQGHTHIVEVLVKNGANVNYRNKKGQSVLWLACYEGHTDIVLLLLSNHAEVDLPTDNERGETSLFAASQQGQYDTAALLIKHGADVDYLRKRGFTSLYFASYCNHLRLAELLLASGADINKGVQSPLYAACLNGNMEMVQLLVHHHAEIDKPCDDEYAATPLITASIDNHIDVVRFFLDNGANINLQNKNGKSPLQCACQEGNIDIVKLLIESHANIELQNKEGRTALMVAVWRCQLLVVIELVRAQAKTDAQDQEGLTSLMLATQKGRGEIVEVLLDANADLNITENTAGWTALHFAAKSGNLGITKQLLLKGANTDIKDNNGLTAIEVCEDEDVCDQLRQYAISKEETNPQPTEQDTEETPKVAEEVYPLSDSEITKVADTKNLRNKDLVKKSYQKLLKKFALLEESLLPGRREKRLHQQTKRMSSNVRKANQQLLKNVN